jgi:hypothetical protein
MEVSDFIEYLKILTQNDRSVWCLSYTIGVMPTEQNNALHKKYKY